MSLRPNIDTIIGVIMFGLCFHLGWAVLDLVLWIIVWVASHLH